MQRACLPRAACATLPCRPCISVAARRPAIHLQGHPMDTAPPATLFPRKLLLAAGVLLALSGCASMTPEECLHADWYEKGMQDGLRGQPRAYVEDHREACGKVGVVPNAAL